jgi:AcrR family transcriptional regulator
VRRRELVEAAIRAVHRVGPNATMGDIAAEADLTKPVVYACFKSKAGLGSAIFEHYHIRIRQEALLTLESARSQRAVVRAIVAPLVAFVESEPDVYRFLIVALGTSTSTHSPSLFGPFGGLVADRLSVDFDTIFQGSGADPRPAEMLAYTVLAAAFSSVEWWDRRTPRRTSAKEITDWITDFICGGMAGVGLA